MDYTHAILDNQTIKIQTKRNNRLYWFAQYIFLFIFISLAILLAYRIFPQELPFFFLISLIHDYLPMDKIITFGIFILWIGTLYGLLKKHSLEIDRKLGIVKNSNNLLGKKEYYFAEIKKIECEIDMSSILLKLSNRAFHRIYFRLHNSKLILVSEEQDKEHAQNLCQRLKTLFQVDVQTLQKLGHQRDGQICLGDYNIIRELSQGGMGKVFLARDQNNQIVALKVLPSEQVKQNDYLRNFVREIRILQKLSHPGIIRILSVGKDTSNGEDVYFYTMEYIEGRPISDMIKKHDRTLEECAIIMMQTAFALDYAHQKRIIHRDIKPANIMLRNNGQIVIIDFGIATDTSRVLKGKSRIDTPDGLTHCLGTLPYMSPEQILEDGYMDYRTDIYSLGVTFYEMITGELPYSGSNATIYRLIKAGNPIEPKQINPNIPDDLNTIVLRAIEKNPKHRYQSAGDFARDIHRWIRGETIRSRPIGFFSKVWRFVRSLFGWIT